MADSIVPAALPVRFLSLINPQHRYNPNSFLTGKVFLVRKVTLIGRFVALRVLRFSGPPSTNVSISVTRKVSHGAK
jgi:hypothetical protein